MSAIADGPSRIDVDLIREAFDHSPVGIAVMSPDGVFRAVNRALCELMGYTRSALEGESYRGFVPAADVASDEEHLRVVREGGVPPESVDTRLVRKDGTQVWVRVSAVVIRDPASGERCIVSTIID